jgi:hypothetical protein
MPSILLCWPITSEADVGGIVVKVESSRQCTVSLVVVRQVAAAEQSIKIASDIEVLTKQRCVIEFLTAEQIAPTDIHRRFLKVYGDDTVESL